MSTPIQSDFKDHSPRTPSPHPSEEVQITAEQIAWLRSVNFNAKSGSIENRVSLALLAKTAPETENPLLKQVIQAISDTVQSIFTADLNGLTASSRAALSFMRIISPGPVEIRPKTPVFFQ